MNHGQIPWLCLCQITRWYASTTPDDIISQLLGIWNYSSGQPSWNAQVIRVIFSDQHKESQSLDFYALIWCSTVPFRATGLHKDHTWLNPGGADGEFWVKAQPVIFRRSVTLVFGHANKLPGCYMLAGRQMDLTVDDQPEQRLKSAAPAAPDLWDRNLSRGFPLDVFTTREGILYLQSTQHTGIHRKKKTVIKFKGF